MRRICLLRIYQPKPRGTIHSYGRRKPHSRLATRRTRPDLAYPHGCGEQVLLVCRFRCFYGPYPRTWGTVITGDQAAEMRQLNPILRPEDILIRSDYKRLNRLIYLHERWDRPAFDVIAQGSSHAVGTVPVERLREAVSQLGDDMGYLFLPASSLGRRR